MVKDNKSTGDEGKVDLDDAVDQNGDSLWADADAGYSDVDAGGDADDDEYCDDDSDYADDYDADTADAIIQTVFYKEVIFG